MRRRRPTATTLYLTGASNSTWQICTADEGALFELQFADASAPVIVHRTSDLHADRHPRALEGLDAVNGEPLRFTIAGQPSRRGDQVGSGSRPPDHRRRCRSLSTR